MELVVLGTQMLTQFPASVARVWNILPYREVSFQFELKNREKEAFSWQPTDCLVSAMFPLNTLSIRILNSSEFLGKCRHQKLKTLTAKLRSSLGGLSP